MLLKPSIKAFASFDLFFMRVTGLRRVLGLITTESFILVKCPLKSSQQNLRNLIKDLRN